MKIDNERISPDMLWNQTYQGRQNFFHCSFGEALVNSIHSATKSNRHQHKYQRLSMDSGLSCILPGPNLIIEDSDCPTDWTQTQH